MYNYTQTFRIKNKERYRKSISDALIKMKELLNSKDIMEDFDQEVFNALVDYVIIGGYDENGMKTNI